MRSTFVVALTGASFAIAVEARAQTEAVASNNNDDAFGRFVGFESIGLYSEKNHRIEGHYFARGSSPTVLLRSGTSVRIGVNALRYDFPAPSGVVEFDLLPSREGSSLRVDTGHRALNGPYLDLVGSTRLATAGSSASLPPSRLGAGSINPTAAWTWSGKCVTGVLKHLLRNGGLRGSISSRV